MATYDDEKFGPLFPVRTGVPQGVSTERCMLDAIGGAEGFRTRIIENADGSSTMLRTKNGSPQFSTAQMTPTATEVQTVCNLTIDSGIVDLRNTSYQGKPAIPVNIYDAGFLFESDYVKNHNAEYVLDFYPVRKPEAPSGKFTGDVRVSGGLFTSAVPFDGLTARSFAPGVLSDGTLNPKDEILANKKFMARWCPPSVFTGRCRLYVQSIYGAPLHSGENIMLDGVFTKTGAPSEIPTIGTLPSLIIKGYGSAGEVTLTTSCGVHLDAKGRHWLFVAGLGSVAVYPLRSSACGEMLRVKLAETRDENLEAYILSQCRPVVSDRQDIPLTESVAPNACSYGWHWNWEGLTADIVSLDSFEQDSAHTGMTSTHYRLSMSIGWSASISIVEGPKQWAVNRQMACIAAPLWGSNFLQKISPRYTTPIDCDAPFYVFYLRDTLTVCRISQQIVPANDGDSGVSEGYLTGKKSLGMKDGYFIDEHVDTAYKTFISVGGKQFETVTNGGFKTSRRSEVTGKRKTGEIVDYGEYLLSSYSFDVGYPAADGTYAQVTYANPGWSSGQLLSGNYADQYVFVTNNEEQYAESNNGFCAVAIPHNDAEAIYVYTNSESSRDQVYKNVLTFRTAAFSKSNFINYYVDASTISHRSEYTESFLWFQLDSLSIGTAVSSNIEGAKSSSSGGSPTARLICRAGEVTASFNAAQIVDFRDDLNDSVGATFSTISGVRVDFPVVISSTHIEPVGAGAGKDSILPVIVGCT